MQIDLLRHGECEGGAIFRGSLDVPLTETGWQQMHSGLAELNANWAAVVSSPLARCRRFALLVSQREHLPLQLEPGVREINFGTWEGQTVERIWREQATLCQAWSKAPDAHTPPGGEPFSRFKARVLRAIHQRAQHYPNQRILLVTHGGVIKLLLTEALGTGAAGMMQLQVGYGFSTSIKVARDAITLAQPLPDFVRYP
jgi:alpha-ribazole phosphatase